MDDLVTVYGVVGSQPARAVLWALKMKNQPFNFVRVIPPKDTRTPEFLKMNPSGTIPALKDGNFTLWESGAILCYLADKYHWTDLYPTDLKKRGEVNQWLHWHHLNSRKVQIGMLMPLMRPDLAEQGLWGKNSYLNAINALEVMEKYLGNHDFFACGHFTLADLQIYQDIGQARKKYIDVIDFSKYPNIVAWMDRVESQPEAGWLHNKLTKVGKWMQKAKRKNGPFFEELKRKNGLSKL